MLVERNVQLREIHVVALLMASITRQIFDRITLQYEIMMNDEHKLSC
jgi:hypothetical protein